MVRPGPASQTGRKRDSVEIEQEDSSAEMKKLKVDTENGLSSISGPESEALKGRIKTYLEENRNLKFIDIEEMSKNLHNAYPEYRRRKLAVFKGQVDGAFKTLTESLAKRNALKKSKKQRKDDKSSSIKHVEEIRLEDETTVKGSSMNSRISSLYSDSTAVINDSLNEGTDDILDDDICEVINDDEVLVTNDVASNLESVDITSSGEEHMTEFEIMKLKVKTVAAAEKSENVSNSTPKNKVPSKNLSAFMSTSLGTSPVKTAIGNTPKDCVSSLPTPAPICSNEVISCGKSTSSSSNVPLTSSVRSNKVKAGSPLGSEGGNEREITDQIEEKLSGKKRPIVSSGSKKRKKLDVSVQYSTSTFEDFGGNEDVLYNICKLLVHLKHPEVYMKLGVTPPRGFLLHGPPGCGKTLLANSIAGELQLPYIKISAPEIVSGVSGESEQKLRDLFDEAIANSPCLLFIDEIDSITPKRENAQREMERRIVAQLLSCLDELSENPELRVVVIGATNRPDSLDPALRRAGRFDREIALGIPDLAARKKILEVVCRGLRLKTGTDFENLAVLTPGYVGADLTSLTREAAMAAVSRVFGELYSTANADLSSLLVMLRDTSSVQGSQLEGLFIENDDWKTALKIVQPSAKREGFATVPDVTWADVGALDIVREELQLAILAPVTHHEQFNSLGLPQSSGVLLVGPPGCGKTLVAKAIANEAGINFISVKGPELLNMYVGESERAVRSVFQRAKNSRPCVIFFDEIDSLCPKRSSSSTDSGSSSRVVNQLLTEMDGVEGRAGVWIMAATNRPDILDPAVLRPGRLDKILYVGFPKPSDRVEILKALSKNGTRPRLGQDVCLKRIGEDSKCNGFSGADVGNLLREASMNALRENMKKRQKDVEVIVENHHFERALSCIRPSVNEKDRLKYLAMGNKYVATGDHCSEDNRNISACSELPERRLDEIGSSINANISQSVTSTSIHENQAPDDVSSCSDNTVNILEDIKTPNTSEISPDTSMNPTSSNSPNNAPPTTPSKMNEEVSNFYSSIEEDSNMPNSDAGNANAELRFLPDMIIRVMDSTCVKEIAGKAGKILNVRSGGSKATVKIEGLSGARIVAVKEIEVELPEEGDKVKSLIWGSSTEVGSVESLDDNDNAVVKYSNHQSIIQIDMLCKVDIC